jgi:hypothetical protein
MREPPESRMDIIALSQDPNALIRIEHATALPATAISASVSRGPQELLIVDNHDLPMGCLDKSGSLAPSSGAGPAKA